MAPSILRSRRIAVGGIENFSHLDLTGPCPRFVALLGLTISLKGIGAESASPVQAATSAHLLILSFAIG
jgi:hypothetical protein